MRPDVILDIGDGLWICEIKPYAGYVAYGQAIQYARLADRIIGHSKACVPVIITDVPNPDLIIHEDGDDPMLIYLDNQIVPRPSRPT